MQAQHVAVASGYGGQQVQTSPHSAKQLEWEPNIAFSLLLAEWLPSTTLGAYCCISPYKSSNETICTGVMRRCMAITVPIMNPKGSASVFPTADGENTACAPHRWGR